MKIEFDEKEVIPFENFELNWRWDEIHNPNITFGDKEKINPLSIMESKRINKVIDYFESEDNLEEYFETNDWFIASSTTKEAIEKFSFKFNQMTHDYNENLFISWNRTTVIYTTKEIFTKYWADFCYPSSDNVTIISELTNWVYFYNHIEIGQFWKRKK